MNKASTNPRRMIAASIVMIMTLALGAAGASAQVFVGEADFSAYAHGTVIHVDAAQQGDLEEGAVRVANLDVASATATVDPGGLAGVRSNELGIGVVPDEPGSMSHGRGFGIGIGLGTEVPDGEHDAEIAGLATASAPPTDGPNTEEIGPVPAEPIAWASVARGEAFADWLEDGCPEGDYSRGYGFVANAQLLDAAESPASASSTSEDSSAEESSAEDDAAVDEHDEEEAAEEETAEESATEAQQEEREGLEEPVISTEADDPQRSVSWTRSRTYLDAQTNAEGDVIGDEQGVVAEQRMTIAPVTLLGGTPAAFTIEFLGEWVLRATASGVPGGAHIHYGPGEVSPETPILRIIQEGEVAGQLLFQDLFGEEGVEIPIGDEGNILANITLGEGPRAIGGEFGSEPEVAGDGTRAAAAVDVVRVTLLQAEGVGRLAQVRIGHMEVEANAPEGGIVCALPPVSPPLPVTGTTPLIVMLGLALMGGAAMVAGRRRLN